MYINPFAGSLYILNSGVAFFKARPNFKDCHPFVSVQAILPVLFFYHFAFIHFNMPFVFLFDPISTEISHKIPAGSRMGCYLCDV